MALIDLHVEGWQSRDPIVVGPAMPPRTLQGVGGAHWLCSELAVFQYFGVFRLRLCVKPGLGREGKADPSLALN